MSKYGAFSGRYFLAFWLNTERYFVSLQIQSECGKIRIRKNSVFGQFSRSQCCKFTCLLSIQNIICLSRCEQIFNWAALRKICLPSSGSVNDYVALFEKNVWTSMEVIELSDLDLFQTINPYRNWSSQEDELKDLEK